MQDNSTPSDDEGLRERLTDVFRAYRHSNTDDLELLTTTVERPEMVEIEAADKLIELAVDTTMALISQKTAEAYKKGYIAGGIDTLTNEEVISE